MPRRPKRHRGIAGGSTQARKNANKKRKGDSSGISTSSPVPNNPNNHRIQRHLQDSSTAHRGHEELPLLLLDLQEKYHPLNNMKLLANPTTFIILVERAMQALIGVASNTHLACYTVEHHFLRNNGRIP
jgi:hypothetical protein